MDGRTGVLIGGWLVAAGCSGYEQPATGRGVEIALAACDDGGSDTAAVFRPRGPALPGVALSEERGEVYLAAETGGLDAHDAESGEVLWNRPDRLVPLWAWGDRLVALSPAQPALLLLDLEASGATLWTSHTLRLPAGVRAEPRVDLGESFELAFDATSASAVVGWTFSRREPTGSPPDPSHRPALVRTAGRFQVDVTDETVTDACGLAPVPSAPQPAAVSERYWTGGRWEVRPFLVDERVLALRVGAEGIDLVEVTAVAGTAPVTRVPAASPWPQLSPDGRLLLVQDVAAPSPRRWTVVTADGSEDRWQAPATGPVEGAARLGDLLLLVVDANRGPFDGERRGVLPRTLIAYRADAETAWEVALLPRPLLTRTAHPSG